MDPQVAGAARLRREARRRRRRLRLQRRKALLQCCSFTFSFNTDFEFLFRSTPQLHKAGNHFLGPLLVSSVAELVHQQR